MTITVNANLFSATARFTSNEETRYYLHGIHFEPHPSGGVTMAATDGHRLFAAYDETAEAEDLPEAGVIIKPPKQKMPAKWFNGEGSVTLRDNLARVAAFTRGSLFEDVAAAPVIDTSFPEWRRVVPSSCSGVLGSYFFNARYLLDFQEIGDRLGCPDFPIHPNEGNPALITFPGAYSCFGVIMPKRGCADSRDGRPDWIDTPPATAQAAE